MRLAHRGDWRSAPENTIAAFQAALRVPGCDGVELDVRASADGVPVVLHDETLERVQGVAARAASLTAAQLAMHGIPALVDVCDVVGRRPHIEVELKEWVPAAIDVLEVARAGARRRTVISSFDDETLQEVRRRQPHWRRQLNSFSLDTAVISRASSLGCAGISAEWHSIGADGVAAAQAANLTVSAWIVRRRPTYRRLEALGVVSICAEAAALDG
jgi:glycerophosphoryl diester phosphodiesterase